MTASVAPCRVIGSSSLMKWSDDEVGAGKAALTLLAFPLWRLAFRLLLISGWPSASFWSVVLPDLKLTILGVYSTQQRLHLVCFADSDGQVSLYELFRKEGFCFG